MADATDQSEMGVCPYDQKLFLPKRPNQVYCNDRCRRDFQKDFGATGKAVSVRRLTKGRVSIVLHLDGSAAEHALRYAVGQALRIVDQPKPERRR